MQPALLVLAAGMGSRYGSLKQMDGVGPYGEAIIDYSIYDAIKAGFGRVVFVIRHAFEREFREIFTEARFGGRIKVDFVFQELDCLPEGFDLPEGREKPWGTNHAVMMATGVVEEPFAVINADDFYGRGSYAVMGHFLQGLAGSSNRYAMVGYEVRNTLSDFGTVSRGVCGVDDHGNLTSMVEHTKIERVDGRIVSHTPEGDVTLAEDMPVSMNFFGFTPDYFPHSREYFNTFLRENRGNLKSEFLIPLMVNKLVSGGTATMKVLPTDSPWFGVTYKEDRPITVARIAKLIEEGLYPKKLWG